MVGVRSDANNPESKQWLVPIMAKNVQRRVAEEAARFMVDGTETEYLQAKERALLMLGLSDQTRMPTNKAVREYVSRLTRSKLGEDEVRRRVREMREIAEQIMATLEDCDPFLVGSTLTGQIRETSDIDLHSYSDDPEQTMTLLSERGYEGVEAEVVENFKGTFVHLRWDECSYPVEITIYPWSWRDVVLNDCVTGKPMKRADIAGVRHLLRSS
ncbi:MAG: hypothetical protein K2W95_16320 [Candidatus Obscuribacterales bacterium]|nr:hypothetical protein [Candidatus Obscuribacterales bacterium]